MQQSFNLEIKEKEYFEEGIFRILDKLHTDSAKYVMARSRQHHNIHETRTNIKKIRGVLRLLRHEIGDDTYHELNNYYSSIAREISVLRDDTSQIELLHELKKKAKDQVLIRALNSAIKQLYKKRKNEFERFIRHGQAENIHQMILSMQNMVHELDFSGHPESFILKSLQHVHQCAKSAWEITGFLKQDEIYHYWRKQVKYLMYHLMLLNKAWPPAIRIYIGELSKLGTLLGTLHDLDILDESLDNSTILITEEQKKALRRLISSQRSGLKKRITPLGERTFGENSESFAMRIFDIWTNSVMNKKGHKSTPGETCDSKIICSDCEGD